MPIREQKFLPNAHAVEHLIPSAITTANSLTAREFHQFVPGYAFAFTRLGLGNRTETGAVTIDARIAESNGMVSAPLFAKDAGEPEDMQVGAFSFFLNNTVLAKALTTGIDFSAAYVVTQNLWGVFILQINASGTLSTLAAAATQGYTTAAAALKAIPAPTANNVIVGAIVLQANTGANWTANTDDLTAGSDCQTITFYQGQELFPNAVKTPTTAACAAVSGQYTTTTVKTSTSFFHTLGSKTATVILTQTTDGTGALADGNAMYGIRPYPLNGEVPVDIASVL